MSGMSINPVPGKCANLVCPNQVGEGAWQIVTTSEPVVGGHRPLILSMCAPCASAFVKLSRVDVECPCDGDGTPGSPIYGEHTKSDHDRTDEIEAAGAAFAEIG